MAVSITKHQWLFDSSLRKTLYKNCTEKCCLFNNILIGRHLDGVGGIDFKNNISIGNGVVLEAAGGIEIGDNTIIEDDVVIVSNTHDYKKLSLPMLLAPVTIGSNVHIGRGTLILGGVTIPSGSIIREGSFIRK